MKIVTQLEFYENELKRYTAQLEALEASKDYENFIDEKTRLKAFYQSKITGYKQRIETEKAKGISVTDAIKVFNKS